MAVTCDGEPCVVPEPDAVCVCGRRYYSANPGYLVETVDVSPVFGQKEVITHAHEHGLRDHDVRSIRLGRLAWSGRAGDIYCISG